MLRTSAFTCIVRHWTFRSLRQALAAALLLLATALHAQPGAIDPTFNSTDIGFGNGDGANVTVLTTALQSDGKVLIGGAFTNYNGTGRNRIARLNADGSLDASFNPGAGANSFIRTTALQADGKIIIGGNFTNYNGTGRNYIARLNADGSLDASFNPGAGANSTIWTTALQADGKILIGGAFTNYNGTGRNYIVRLHADGSLDASFNPGTGANSTIWTIAVRSDGKIIIGGDFTNYNGTGRNYIARLNADGSLDASFNPGTGANSGIFTTSLQADGKIIIGGDFTNYNGTGRNRIARLNADGSLDASFNPGTAANNFIRTTALQADGKIIIGGDFTNYNGTGRNYIVRLHADGSLDTGFNPDGPNDIIFSTALQADGKILIGGQFTSYSGTGRNRIARVRGDYDCLLLNANIGDPCDDGNPLTGSDAVNGNCACAGVLLNTISFTFEPTPLCADNMTNYSVFMTATGSYTFPGNNWVVELSDINGSFASPTVVAFTAFDALFGELVFQVPLNTPAGTGYRIRVRSTDPVVISPDNGVDLTVVAPTLWYADADGDGFGDPAVSQAACAQPVGYVANNTDCDVDDAGAYPGAPCTTGDPCITGETLDANCNCTGGTSTATTNTTNTSACTFYTWAVNGQTYTVGGTYTETVGCTTEVLNLTLTGCSVCGTSSPTVCGTSYFWNITGQTYTQSGTYVYVDPTGCTVITLNLTLIPPFTPCDDGNPNTTGDTYDANCNCVGLLLDCNGDAGGTASIDACGVCSGGNTGIVPNSTCADCNGVPNGPAVPGSGCDDGDPNTANDVWQVGCICAGTPVVTCTTDLVLEFRTDGNGTQTTWEIRQQGTNALAQSGGGWYPNNVTLTDNTCLPDGCFYLRVLDSGGDGIANGGYILRTLTGAQRIIDNRDNFTTGSVSAVVGNGGFCLPLGGDKLIFTSCDKLDWVNNQYIVAAENPAVSAQWGNGDQTDDGYQFWWFDPNGGYGYSKFRSHATSDGFGPANAVRACHARINNWTPATNIPANVLMNVKVRSRVNGVNSNWGPVCRFKIDPVRAACPLTKLMDIPGNVNYSCGVTRAWGSGAANKVVARPVEGATQYQFRFTNGELGTPVIRTTTTPLLQLNWSPALDNGTYEVQVRAYKNGQWCVTSLPWGDVCNVTITGSPNAMVLDGGSTTSTGDAKLALFPNPNNGQQLTVSLSAVEAGVETIAVDIFDLNGARVSAQVIAVNDGLVYQVVDVAGLADGLYMVNITAGGQRYTERLVIAK